MTNLKKEELELFRRLDKKCFLVSKNDNLKEWLAKSFSNYPEQDVQSFIDKLACWYWVKFPDQLFDKKGHSDDNLLKLSNRAMSLNALFQNLNGIESEFINFNNISKEEIELKELFCQYLLKLAGYKMIYAKNTTPNYGAVRVELMFRDFNQCFHWNLSVDMYQDIMERDYSLDNPLNVMLLHNLRENQKKETNKKGKKKTKKKKSRRFFHS